MSNPFIFGGPVPPTQFIGRVREVRRIVGRIRNWGQSTAIVGEPRLGKTSLLHYLTATDKRNELYGEVHARLLCSYLDAQTLGTNFDQAAFWKYVLTPVREKAEEEAETQLREAYNLCASNHFGAFVLERLCICLKDTNWRLVVAVDEFDTLLHHSHLNSAEFFGSLRSVISRSGGAIALILASRQHLGQLNTATQNFSRMGSPYFNFLDEIALGPLADKETAALFAQAPHFKRADRRFILAISGGHPYLLQLTASALWDAFQDIGNDETQTRQRWQQAGRDLHPKAKMIWDDTWRVWPAATQRAFVAVGLPYLANMLGAHTFDAEALAYDLGDVEAELRDLEDQGFVQEDETAPNGWRVRPLAFLLPLSEEIRTLTRKNQPVAEWLKEQEQIIGPLKHGQLQTLERAAKAVGSLLQEGGKTLIEAIAKGLGEAAVGK